jgi:1-acyl-sn-glycerol-3-phosphate acyltransferase
MNAQKNTPFLLALYRLWRLFWWLAGAGWRVSRFGRLSPKQRDAAMMGIAERLLKILHIRLNVSCHAQCPANPPVLAVANHVSWLDIFVLMALYPSCFIAKQSIRHWPVVGTLAAHVGTVFINRHSRTDAGNVNQTIARTLAAGQSVTFFPEARTSDGLNVLPFKAALFQAAIDTNTPVQAMALRYLNPHGQRSTAAAWVGDTPFFASLWRIARQPHITAQVDFALLMGSGYTDCADRYQLKDAAEQFIRHKVNGDG